MSAPRDTYYYDLGATRRTRTAHRWEWKRDLFAGDVGGYQSLCKRHKVLNGDLMWAPEEYFKHCKACEVKP